MSLREIVERRQREIAEVAEAASKPQAIHKDRPPSKFFQLPIEVIVEIITFLNVFQTIGGTIAKINPLRVAVQIGSNTPKIGGQGANPNDLHLATDYYSRLTSLNIIRPLTTLQALARATVRFYPRLLAARQLGQPSIVHPGASPLIEDAIPLFEQDSVLWLSVLKSQVLKRRLSKSAAVSKKSGASTDARAAEEPSEMIEFVISSPSHPLRRACANWNGRIVEPQATWTTAPWPNGRFKGETDDDRSVQLLDTQLSILRGLRSRLFSQMLAPGIYANCCSYEVGVGDYNGNADDAASSTEQSKTSLGQMVECVMPSAVLSENADFLLVPSPYLEMVLGRCAALDSTYRARINCCRCNVRAGKEVPVGGKRAREESGNFYRNSAEFMGTDAREFVGLTSAEIIPENGCPSSHVTCAVTFIVPMDEALATVTDNEIVDVDGDDGIAGGSPRSQIALGIRSLCGKRGPDGFTEHISLCHRSATDTPVAVAVTVLLRCPSIFLKEGRSGERAALVKLLSSSSDSIQRDATSLCDTLAAFSDRLVWEHHESDVTKQSRKKSTGTTVSPDFVVDGISIRGLWRFMKETEHPETTWPFSGTTSLVSNFNVGTAVCQRCLSNVIYSAKKSSSDKPTAGVLFEEWQFKGQRKIHKVAL